MGTESVDILIQRAQVLRSRQPDQAMSLLDDALALAQKTGYRKGLATIIREKAICHLEQKHYKRALSAFNEAYQFYRDFQDKAGQISCLNEISALYFKLGDCPSALQYILYNIDVHTSLGDSEGVANCYIDIGNLYIYLQEYPNAVESYKKALKIHEGLKNKKQMINCFFLLGNAFNWMDDEDRALYYLLRAVNSLDEVQDIDIKAKTLGSLANLYTKQKDYDKALAYFHDALKSAEDGGSINVKVQLRKNLGHLYIELTQFDKAIEVLTSALHNAQHLPPESGVVRIHQLLANAYEQMGDFGHALKHYKKFHDLDKQVASEEVNLKTKALHIKYDLEELRKQKEIAELSDKLKEQFLANVSHEIRTPMNGVLGMTHLLNRTNPTKEQQEYIDAIKVSANNLMVIINDILDFSKINSGKIEFAQTEFNLRELIKGVLQILQVRAEEKSIQLKASVDYHIKDNLSGDPIRLNQILMNLVGNAVKFTDKGSVTLEVKQTDLTGDHCRLRFRIIDTGIGIPDNKLQKIFESFEQAENNKRRYEGTGLGLTIVKQLVELQGGTISVKSRVGEGSEFTVELPFRAGKNQSEQAPATEVPAPVQRDLSHVRILVVEDNKVNQLLVKNMLRKFGFELFDTAENGKSALQKLEENDYDLVLMDIQMPEMDGYEITKIIRSKMRPSMRNTPVIALTADASEKERINAQDAGMNDYVVKPYTPDDLYNAIVRFTDLLPSLQDGEAANARRLQEKRRHAGMNLDFLDKFTGGDKDLTVQLIEIFLRQLPEAIVRLEQKIPAGDWKEVHAIAHKLKSSIAIFELTELRKLITNIEEYARDKENLQDIPGIFKDFRSGASTAIHDLEAELQKLKKVRA